MVIYIQDLNGNWLNVWVGIVIECRYSINIFVCKNRAEMIFEGVCLFFTISDGSSIVK